MRPLPSLRPPLCRGQQRKVDRLQTIRFGSARYSVPTTWVGRTLEIMVQDGEVVIGLSGEEITRHQLQPPGGASIQDEHYSGPARRPARAIRVRTETERAFIALGPVAEGFLRSAAAAGTSRLAAELAEIVSLEPLGSTAAGRRLGAGHPLSPLQSRGCPRHPGRGRACTQPCVSR